MSKSKIVYEEVKVTLRAKHNPKGPMTVDEMKELIGWETEESTGEDFGKEYKFRDKEGNKVRLANNPTNRPFRMSLAMRYANDMLRGKWALNGETLVIDKRGNFQSGQHRGVGFILAEQERKKNVEHWKEYGWRGPMELEFILVTGIDDSKEVVDTLDLGQKRSLGDVIFRNQDFGKLNDKEAKKLGNVKAGAARLVWLRVGGQIVSDAPHFPHSEALEFLEKHTRIHEAVEFINNEEGGAGSEGKKISQFVSLGYAAGLLYLMAAAKTKPEEFENKGVDGIDFSLWDKACKFWVLLASGANLESGDPILVLRGMLSRLDASGGSGRDEICGTIINAWNAWIDRKKGLKATDLKVKRARDEHDRLVLVETPRIGGLDVAPPEPEEEEEEEVEETEEGEAEEAAPKKKKKGKAKKGAKGKKKGWPNEKTIGEWVWVFDPDGEHWKGKLAEYNGDTCAVTADDKKTYAVDTENIRADKPEDE